MNSYLIEEQEPSVKAIGIILSNSNSTNTDTLLSNEQKMCIFTVYKISDGILTEEF